VNILKQCAITTNGIKTPGIMDVFGLKINTKYTSAIPPEKQTCKFTNKEF